MDLTKNWDENCPACRAARGRQMITADAHTCNICWACRADKAAGRPVIGVNAHICGKSNNPKDYELRK